MMKVAKKPVGKGKSATHQRMITRLFNGLPVEDADEELIIKVIKADIAKAKRKDPFNCVFAQACLRIHGSHNAAFFRGYAYVEKGGKVRRYVQPQATRNSILVFDKAGKADPGGYLLRPPSRTDTLDYKMQVGRAYRASRQWSEPARKTRKPVPDFDFRSGTGMLKQLVKVSRAGK